MPQAIMSPVGITTYGSAFVRADPDFAHLSVTAGHEDPSSGAALAAARERLVVIQRALRACGVEERDVNVGTVQIHRTWEDRGPRKYAAAYELQVTLRDLEAIDSIVIAVSETGAVIALSLAFHSSEMRQLRASARTLAAEAARAKAQGYAAAAGVSLGDVVHIEDLNPEFVGYRGHGADLDFTPALEFDPSASPIRGSLMVRAAVMVAYAIAS